MVSKGLDFEKVNLVGVFDIDRMIHFPDFRSHERVFQLLTQVSGRAGRKSGQGSVLIQTQNISHPIFPIIIQNNYLALYENEISERAKYMFPPFCRLIKLTLKNEDKVLLEESSKLLAEQIRQIVGKTKVLGPEPPLIDKIRDLYLKDIFIKLEKDKVDIKKAKKLIQEMIRALMSNKKYRSVFVVIDVDPI